MIRYSKLNAWFRTSICLIVSGLYVLTVSSVSDTITDHKPFVLQATNLADWSNPYINGNISTVILIACTMAALLFACAGIFRSKRYGAKKQSGANREEDLT